MDNITWFTDMQLESQSNRRVAHKNYLKQVVKKGYLMKLAKDGKDLPRGANKDPLQWTAPPAQQASRGPFKGHLCLRVSPISGSLFAILLL